MMARRSTYFLTGTALLLILLALLGAHSRYSLVSAKSDLAAEAGMVRRLELTDLCLFTEASYTRHPGMTDLNTPFQDSPFVFEHFPSGALVEPPLHMGRTRVQFH